MESTHHVAGSGGGPWKRRGLSPVARAGLLMIFLLAGVAVVYLTPLRELLRHTERVTAELQSGGFASRGLYVLMVAVLVGIGFPRLLLCPIGGFAFGFWEGLLWSEVGTTAGSYFMFLAVRWGGRSYVAHRHPRLADAAARIAAGGLPFVMLARLVPVAGSVINIVLGLMPLKHRDFLIGTVIGTIPEAVPATMLGKGIKHGSLEHSLMYVTAGVLILLVLWLFLAWMWRSSRSRAVMGVKDALTAEYSGEQGGN